MRVKVAFNLPAMGFGLMLALGPAGAALGQRDPMAERLSAERVSDIAAGAYATDAGRQFALAPYGEKYLLRFTDSPENFVMTVDRGSLGAKMLEYDTGATALRVSVWGGLTLYTSDAPNGVPATHQGDASLPNLTPVSAADLGAALRDEASHLSYLQNIALNFAADPEVMKSDGDTRAVAFDTLSNTGMGIERFLREPDAKKALVRRISTVRVTEGAKPTVIISGRSLMVSFVRGEGYDGRASSHAIAHALGKLLQVSTQE
jgi:hypothetical protein